MWITDYSTNIADPGAPITYVTLHPLVSVVDLSKASPQASEYRLLHDD